MFRFLFCSLVCFPLLMAQEPEQKPLDPANFDQVVNSANGVMKIAWPFMVAKMRQQLTESLEDMGDGDVVRKMRVTELALKEAPRFVSVPCPGDPQCRRLRLSVPGDGKWSLKMSGEIIPPWQKNQEKYRKLRLTLKDLSLVQDYEVDLSDPEKLIFQPMGPPKLTYRLTSPNLLYKAVLAAAQRFLRNSLESVLEEEFQNMPATEIALGNMRDFKLDTLLSGMGSSLGVDSVGDDYEDESLDDPMDAGEAVVLFPLEERVPEQPPLELSDDAFKVAFANKEIDHFAESFVATVDIEIPPGQRIEDVTFKLGSREIARLTQPPWRLEVKPGDEDQVLLATATLADGIQEDDYLFIQGRGHIEEFEVNLVNLYLNFPDHSVSEKELRLMTPEEFHVTENGIKQHVSTMDIAIDRPLELVLAVDMSGSMEGNRLKAARSAAGQFIQKVMRPGDSMHLIAYNSKLVVGKRLDQKRQMLQAVKRLKQPKGDTRTYDAVNKALGLLSKGNKDATRVILLITDGHNYGSKITYGKLKRKLEKTNVLLYTVGIDIARRDRKLAGGGEEGMMRMIRPSKVHLQQLYDISAITGGRPFFVDKPSWLGRAFDAIEEDLHSQIRLGFYSNLPPSRKGWRKLEVRRVGADTPIHHKEGYWKE